MKGIFAASRLEHGAGHKLRLVSPTLESLGGWLDALAGEASADSDGEAREVELQTWAEPFMRLVP